MPRAWALVGWALLAAASTSGLAADYEPVDVQLTASAISEDW